MPIFKEEVEKSLAMKKLNDSNRKYMCRVLSTVLQTYVQKPSMKHCEIVAKALVRKFPFLKEYVSYLSSVPMWYILYEFLDCYLCQCEL